ncbi:MAG: sialidase family protein [Betaproteobacteria bacterium]
MLTTDIRVHTRWNRCAAPAIACLLALAACSGGGGGGSPPPTTTPPGPVTPSGPAGLVSGASTFTANCGGASAGTLYPNAEVEPHLAINPANPNNLIGSWQQDRWSGGAAQGTAVGYSLDAGATWITRPLPASRCGGGNAANGGDFERATDPWVTFSPNGVAYQMSLAVTGGTLAPGSASAMLVFRSTDSGQSWSSPAVLIRDGDQFFNDKNTITADPTDSRYVFAVWDRLTQDNRGPAFFARTTDGGLTWEPAHSIFDPGIGNQTLGSVIGVLPDGTLIDFFNRLDTVGNALVGSFQAMRSTDKGVTWSAPAKVADFFGIGTHDPDTSAAIRDAGYLPQIAVGPQGQIYATWQDARFSNGARDGIAFVRSTDGGLTWSAPLQINGAPGVQALTPTVNARADGTLGVSYFDMRNNTPDITSLPVDYWLATSRDGVSWTDRRVTATSFELGLAPVARGLFLGDYMGLASSGSTFYPFYVRTTGDLTNRNDVFLTPITVASGAAAASVTLRLAAEVPAFVPDAEHRQRIQANLVRGMDQRAPGWARLRGWKVDTE